MDHFAVAVDQPYPDLLLGLNRTEVTGDPRDVGIGWTSPLEALYQAGRKHWEELHIKENADQAWFEDWFKRIPQFGCKCRDEFAEILTRFPPHFGNDWFPWTVTVHNEVNAKLMSQGSYRPQFTLPQAYGKWRRQGVYESTPTRLQKIDVIMPFHNGDSQFVEESIEGILNQRHVWPIVHLVADGPEVRWPIIVPPGPRGSIRKYTAPYPMGPYRIANSIVRHHSSAKYIALQDADDISLPDRLWKQITTMERYGYEMTSCAMEQFVCGTYHERIQKRIGCEPVLYSGTKFDHVPGGRCINSCRTMTRDLFERLNGFPDQQCSVDFHLDNMCELLNVPVFWSTEILARRRLHRESLTNGPDYEMGSRLREAANQYVADCLHAMQERPSWETAKSFGALEEAIRLD